MPGLRRAVALDGNPFAILGRQLCPASYQFVTRAAKVSYHLLTSGGFGSASGLKIDIPPKKPKRTKLSYVSYVSHRTPC